MESDFKNVENLTSNISTKSYIFSILYELGKISMCFIDFSYQRFWLRKVCLFIMVQPCLLSTKEY